LDNKGILDKKISTAKLLTRAFIVDILNTRGVQVLKNKKRYSTIAQFRAHKKN